MKRNLILAVALLTTSFSAFPAFAAAKPCENTKQDSSAQATQQKHHNKDKKTRKDHDDKNKVDLSIYG